MQDCACTKKISRIFSGIYEVKGMSSKFESRKFKVESVKVIFKTTEIPRELINNLCFGSFFVHTEASPHQVDGAGVIGRQKLHSEE